jgi:hypothetical protein
MSCYVLEVYRRSVLVGYSDYRTISVLSFGEVGARALTFLEDNFPLECRHGELRHDKTHEQCGDLKTFW